MKLRQRHEAARNGSKPGTRGSGHHPIVVKGHWREVILHAQGHEVTRHPRLWADEQVSFEPLHCLALLERKPGVLDHARPLAGWTLPECFHLLRHRLEAERDGDATREYSRGARVRKRKPLEPIS